MQVRNVPQKSWLDGFNISHSVEVTGAERVLYVSGQTSNDASGAPMHPGDLVAQFKLAWKNVLDVLAEAKMEPRNIVRLNFYTTDVEEFMAKAGELVPIYAESGCKPAATLLGVTRLFEPSIMIELEVTAVG